MEKRWVIVTGHVVDDERETGKKSVPANIHRHTNTPGRDCSPRSTMTTDERTHCTHSHTPRNIHSSHLHSTSVMHE